MPVLAAFLGSLFTNLVSFFALWFTKRIAIFAAVIIALGGTVAIFVTALNVAFTSIVISYPTGWVASGIGLLPSNTNVAISAIITAELARWVHDWQVRVLQMRLL